MLDKGVIFWDFDGTLVYPNTRFIDTFLKCSEDVGFSFEEVEKHFKSIYPWLNFDKIYPDKTDKWWETFLESITPLYKSRGVSAERAEKISADFKKEMIENNTYHLYEDAVCVLDTLRQRGYRHYILSNNYPELALIVSDFGIRDFFEDIIVSANVGYEKPRAELYAYALSVAENPKNAYMIGDNPIADIRGGNAAGLKTVLVHRADSQEAFRVSSSLTELLDFIN